jgi:hypothetical protein
LENCDNTWNHQTIDQEIADKNVIKVLLKEWISHCEILINHCDIGGHIDEWLHLCLHREDSGGLGSDGVVWSINADKSCDQHKNVDVISC